MKNNTQSTNKNNIMIGGLTKYKMNIYDHNYNKYKLEYMKMKSNDKDIMKGGNDPEIIKLDALVKDEMQNYKTVELEDFSGLVMRVGERSPNKHVEIQFIPPKINQYLSQSVGPNTLCTKYSNYYETKYGDITQNQFKDLMLNFNTKNYRIRIAFQDNYNKGITDTFEIELPIKFVDFIMKIFDHFDKVGLVGYPDNGGIDCVTYDQEKDIYFIGTWS